MVKGSHFSACPGCVSCSCSAGETGAVVPNIYSHPSSPGVMSCALQPRPRLDGTGLHSVDWHRCPHISLLCHQVPSSSMCAPIKNQAEPHCMTWLCCHAHLITVSFDEVSELSVCAALGSPGSAAPCDVGLVVLNVALQDVEVVQLRRSRAGNRPHVPAPPSRPFKLNKYEATETCSIIYMPCRKKINKALSHRMILLNMR